MPSSKITKPNGYWVFMNILMFEQDYEGGFKPFAEANDQLWKDLPLEEKKEWKIKAKKLKKTNIYKNAYLPVETALKNNNTVCDIALIRNVRAAIIKCMILCIICECE